MLKKIQVKEGDKLYYKILDSAKTGSAFLDSYVYYNVIDAAQVGNSDFWSVTLQRVK